MAALENERENVTAALLESGVATEETLDAVFVEADLAARVRRG